MAIPILRLWKNYFTVSRHEGLGSSYERIIINNKISEICNQYQVKNIFEGPSFGFTGLSGINSVDLARKGLNVSIADHDEERLRLIKEIWSEINQSVDARYVEDYCSLPYNDKKFDLSWNFAALWYLDDLQGFLSELNRITKKVIVFMVPNRLGLGYMSQKILNGNELKKELNEEFIIPKNFKTIMSDLGWDFVESDYIDCPPWPDIGMPKEDFLGVFGIKADHKKTNSVIQPVTIMDYYSGKDKHFADRMLKYYWFERFAPWIIKRFWSHHHYFLFIKKS